MGLSFSLLPQELSPVWAQHLWCLLSQEEDKQRKAMHLSVVVISENGTVEASGIWNCHVTKNTLALHWAKRCPQNAKWPPVQPNWNMLQITSGLVKTRTLSKQVWQSPFLTSFRSQGVDTACPWTLSTKAWVHKALAFRSRHLCFKTHFWRS